MKINLHAHCNKLCLFALLLIAYIAGAQRTPFEGINLNRSVSSNFNQNVKTVSPPGDVDTSTWLYYSIIIQNTSYEKVQNATIRDTLSSDLDLTSFEYLSTSDTAPVTANITGNVLQFNLPDADLPSQYADSLFSQAYVQFKIKPKAGLAPGTQIFNSATIILGSNPPIITDTTVSTISFTAGISSLNPEAAGGLKIFPNPASQQLFISPTGFVPKWVVIYDINGQIINEQDYKPQLDLSQFANGIYFIEVKNETSTARNRFVKISQ